MPPTRKLIEPLQGQVVWTIALVSSGSDSQNLCFTAALKNVASFFRIWVCLAMSFGTIHVGRHTLVSGAVGQNAAGQSAGLCSRSTHTPRPQSHRSLHRLRS